MGGRLELREGGMNYSEIPVWQGMSPLHNACVEFYNGDAECLALLTGSFSVKEWSGIMFSGAHELSPERLAVVFAAVLILLVWQELGAAVDVLPAAA